jgi:ribonucleoside-diphosphate reductase subunit M2
MQALKMSDSPAKKLDFGIADKENFNSEVAVKVAGIPELDFSEPAGKEEAAVAPGIKDEEKDEPLLRENPQRFVLFPIQHHEV